MQVSDWFEFHQPHPQLWMSILLYQPMWEDGLKCQGWGGRKVPYLQSTGNVFLLTSLECLELCKRQVCLFRTIQADTVKDVLMCVSSLFCTQNRPFFHNGFVLLFICLWLLWPRAISPLWGFHVLVAIWGQPLWSLIHSNRFLSASFLLVDGRLALVMQAPCCHLRHDPRL